MVTAQVVMVAVMTATPLAMHMSGQGLDVVGMVLSVHILGMFALCFIGGSAHLARDLPALERVRIEGTVDGGVWATAAVASLCSTALLATVGYSALTGGAGILVALPALALARKRPYLPSSG